MEKAEFFMLSELQNSSLTSPDVGQVGISKHKQSAGWKQTLLSGKLPEQFFYAIIFSPKGALKQIRFCCFFLIGHSQDEDHLRLSFQLMSNRCFGQELSQSFYG